MTCGPADWDDRELVRRALGGRQDCYAQLLRRHREVVYRLACNSLGDSDEALDITQETFISAFAGLARYDGARPFRSWIARIAINKCHDWARRRKVRRFFTFARPLDEALEIADQRARPDEALAAVQETARLRAAIARLPARLGEVLVLRSIEECSQAETSEILGISQKAVETRLYRARQKLSELLRD